MPHDNAYDEQPDEPTRPLEQDYDPPSKLFNNEK